MKFFDDYLLLTSIPAYIVVLDHKRSFWKMASLSCGNLSRNKRKKFRKMMVHKWYPKRMNAYVDEKYCKATTREIID